MKKKVLTVLCIGLFIVGVNSVGYSATYWNEVDLECCENGAGECGPNATIQAEIPDPSCPY